MTFFLAVEKEQAKAKVPAGFKTFEALRMWIKKHVPVFAIISISRADTAGVATPGYFGLAYNYINDIPSWWKVILSQGWGREKQ